MKKTVIFLLVCSVNLFAIGEEDIDSIDYKQKWEAEEVSRTAYRVHLRQLKNLFAGQMSSRFNLGCYGLEDRGRGKIHLRLYSSRRATVDEARALTITIFNEFVPFFNSFKDRKLYHEESPLPLKSISLSLSFEILDVPWADGTVAHVIAQGDKFIEYDSKNPFSEGLEIILVETYDEAKQRLASSPVANPEIHYVTEKERALDKLVIDCKHAFHKTDELYCRLIGGKISQNIHEIGASFHYFRPVTLSEARELQTSIVQKLLKAFNEDEALRPYLAEYPFPSNRVKIALKFCDLNENGFSHSIDRVMMENNELTYFQSITLDKSLPVDTEIAREPYPEALALVEASKKEEQPISNIRKRFIAWYRGLVRNLYDFIAFKTLSSFWRRYE